ncbi:MAG: phosphate-starvation-inducible PsiE family protein [Nitrospirales bacterium]|nr:phosphate-starvation-inducible PsiE family protein [Nitrospira sp.]MDR4500763.1 phosphate-starvation-inducible PsiE family protein [Nitrospirales bacterium]
MHGWTPESIKQWVKWMQWLDRWGYITACLSFLVLGMLIFVYSWVEFLQHAAGGFLEASITLINDLLLVIILLELFRTVLGFLQSERVRLEPFLHVGVIASVRKILTTGAELSHIKDIPEETFYHYLMDLGLHVVIILVLMLAVYLIKKSDNAPPSTVTL